MSTPDGRSVVIHGHYYQPPREDPWLERVPREPSAAPFHDWNERIEAECYRTVVAARLLDGQGRIAGVMNTLAYTSFDVGPTLMRWLEEHASGTYAAILEADREQRRRLGFGGAVAAPYHHVILPLAARRDKVTEVRWGITDFRTRFGRRPEGMWLPETAVDDETLDVLAAEGIAFTILAPHQVGRVPPGGLPGRYRTGSGREIAVFVYDGPLSHGVAFGDLLEDAGAWAEAMVHGETGMDAANDGPGSKELVALAADGETFGHHQPFGELALAAVVAKLNNRPEVRVENFASFLARHPPTEDVTLVEPSSWSCVHGVERWRTECGCKLDPNVETRQTWRRPLRQALEWLAAELHGIFHQEGHPLFDDPWSVRDAYGEVVAASSSRSFGGRTRFLEAHAPGAGPGADTLRALELLEMERNLLSMFTSCGWFFDDLARIEPLQVLRYAARALELAGPRTRDRLESELVNRLAGAQSNDPAEGSGADLYRKKVRPLIPRTAAVAAGWAAVRALDGDPSPFTGSLTAEAGPEGSVTVSDRRTGAVARWHARVEAEGFRVKSMHMKSVPLASARVAAGQGRGGPVEDPVEPATTKEALEEHGFTVRPEQLPEPLLAALNGAFRRRVVGEHLTAEERELLAQGAATVAKIVPLALERAVAALADGHGQNTDPGDRDSDALSRAEDLLHLLRQEDLVVPYPVRTAFWRVRSALPGKEAARLGALAEALGFAPASENL